VSSRSRDREYRQWRAAVIRRDKRCAICGSRAGRTAHHIDCWSYHPDKRYDVDNGVTLCSHHHVLFHCSYKNSYREECTRKDYDNFIELLTKEKLYNNLLQQ